MTLDTKERLRDGSFRVTVLGRHDGEEYALPKPVEYSATCIRLARKDRSDDWPETADHWAIEINGAVFDYYTGVGHRGKNNKPQKPELSAVLSCLAMDASACSMSFDRWCEDFGYDTDSRKALKTYLECQDTAEKLFKCGVRLDESLTEFLQQY